MYNAALRSEFLHDLEHLTFFAASMFFWWLVTGAGPRIHKQFGQIGRVVFTLSAIPPNMGLGVALAFVGVVVYSYYEAVPRLWGIDPVTDQRIGGIIMWIPGSMMFIIAALILVAQMVQDEDAKPPLPEKDWAGEDAISAPGIKK
jgi:cytochrome c oxidase assembly factor CtaG